ncbi:hypothetical protein CLOM_g5787 [Closterium sp. NIES-68]|nr:hypothetical protein CLOM_g5787 [Closterium sp. NIES-68]GJP73841.1 hypothetical protein CLOP_g4518 [Closterium sp. NIES-67]
MAARTIPTARHASLTLLLLVASSALPLRASASQLGDGYWFAVGNQILDEAGRVVKFSGVNWNGFDAANCVADGLWARGLGEYLDQMASLGFNLIRLNFATSCISPSIRPSDGSIDYSKNPDLEGLTTLEVMDAVIAGAKQRGIRVILSNSRVSPALPPDYPADAGLWFDLGNPERVWLDNWNLLASRYYGERTVVGVDLFNEPHRDPSHPDVTWEADGVNEPYNWRTAAKRAADVVQRVNPDLLIFVQGMDGDDCWWGSNLRPVYFYPLKLNVPYKLVYSIHDYGPMVKDGQPWLYDPAFPANLEGYWDELWGYVADQEIAPVWIGEWGSVLPVGGTDELSQREMKWVNALRHYIRKKSLSWTWFTWGPNSKDTGGVLTDDWDTVEQGKMEVLGPVMHPLFGPSVGERPAVAPRHGLLIVYAPENAPGITMPVAERPAVTPLHSPENATGIAAPVAQAKQRPVSDSYFKSSPPSVRASWLPLATAASACLLLLAIIA